MNSVVASQVEIMPPYQENLAQGRFEMANVLCKCGRQVGYKFVTDLSTTTKNENQVGRFGLVVSRFTVGTALHASSAAREAPPLDPRDLLDTASDTQSVVDMETD